MSINVLKRGELPSEKEYSSECRRCHSLLNWKKSDAKTVWEGDQRDGPFTQIDCPVCGALVTGY